MAIALKDSKRLIYSVLLLALALLATARLVDPLAEEYAEKALTRSLVAFAVARGMNGIISVAQGTEIAVHPAGLGLNFAPGEILDPVNDLLEQFSWVMLACAATLGIQKILLSISGTPLLSAILSITLLYWLLRLWFPEKLKLRSDFILSITLILMFMRFSVPVAAMASEALYSAYLADRYQLASQQMQGSSETFEALNRELAEKESIADQEDRSLIDKAKRYFDQATYSLDYRKTLDKYKDQAAQLTNNAIDLIVIFLIQSLLFPLLTLWALYSILRNIYRTHASAIPGILRS